jgi:hypothetical protein
MRNQRADVPERSALSAGQGARTGRKAIAATWKVARVFAIDPEYADMLGIARPLLEQTPSLIQTGRRA